MLRSLAVLVGVGLVVFQVARAWPEREQDETEREIELLERLLDEKDPAETEQSVKRGGSQEIIIVDNPTEQSTTLGAYSSGKAVDGNLDTNLYPNAKCSHTLDESHPWWRVDLGGIHCIGDVEILNRGDCCSERLQNAVVRAGTSTTPTYNQACGSPVTAAQAAPRAGTVKFNCAPALRARYISVDIPYTDQGVLQLCEVTVEEVPLDQCTAPTDLDIVGQPTQQSSTLGAYSAAKAVDGNRNTDLYPNAKCSHTNDESHPWWRVDLGGEHCISDVEILNRGDCCSERLANAVVRAGTSTTPTDNEACGSPVTAAQAAPPAGIINFMCDHPLRARYVSVDIPYTGQGVLQLCEVTVKELPLDHCPASTGLSVNSLPSAQSSTMGDYQPGKANDGSFETNLYPGYRCSHTDQSSNPWWRVELGGEHCISKVTILNRGDCCSERLTGAVVRAGASATPTDNAACGSPVTAAQAAPSGGKIHFYCLPALRARYVSVDIPGDGQTLQLCEVTVEELIPGLC